MTHLVHVICHQSNHLIIHFFGKYILSRVEIPGKLVSFTQTPTNWSPEPKSKVDIFLSPLCSSKHDSRSLCGEVLLHLLVIFLRICQQVSTKLGDPVPSVGSKQKVNSSEISRKNTETLTF